MYILIISCPFLLRIRNVSDKVVVKIKTHGLSSKALFRKSYRLWNSVENFGRTRQSTDDDIIWHTRFACWINMATNTHSENEILLFFYDNNGHANTPQNYV
jgi:hypothetical protein